MPSQVDENTKRRLRHAFRIVRILRKLILFLANLAERDSY
jgi:hypothetical protein